MQMPMWVNAREKQQSLPAFPYIHFAKYELCITEYKDHPSRKDTNLNISGLMFSSCRELHVNMFVPICAQFILTLRVRRVEALVY